MPRSIVAAIVFCCSVPVIAADAVPPPSGERIVDSDARLELLFTRTVDITGGLTEGPAVAPDGSIYFTDIPVGPDKGLIMRFDPRTMKTTVFTHDSGKANGLIFDADGYLLACEGADYGGRRVSRWNVKTKERETIVDRYMGKRFNAPNDLCLDRHGRIYFTDPRYLGDEPRELEHRAVYRIDTDGSVIEITHDVSKPNGIALSPDGATLYLADHDNGTDKIDPTQPKPEPGPMKIYAFPLGRDGKVSGRRRTLVDFGREAGCDGMTVDEQGHVYLTVRSLRRPGVMVINPAGDEVAFIPTGPPNRRSGGLHVEARPSSAVPSPEKRIPTANRLSGGKPEQGESPVGLPSNVEFGIGDEANVLYVTVDTSLYRIPLNVKGFHVQYEQ